jgi:CMP-N-acetylneuraminic acid synthetase
MDQVVVIPARGGSKGIHRKNLMKVGGIPLLSRTINAAKLAKIENIYVSTDDEEIKSLALTEGVKVIDRPLQLATDHTSTDEVLNHSISVLLNEGFSVHSKLFLLQCTSPFTQANTLTDITNLLNERSGVGVITVTEWHGFLWKKDGEFIQAISHNPMERSRRQDLEARFLETGAVYAAPMGEFIKTRKRFTEKILGYVVSKQESIEVDSNEDLIFAKNLEKF